MSGADTLYGVDTASSDDFYGHVLTDWHNGRWGLTVAVCGARHHKWRPVTEFAVPSVFLPCPKCAAGGVSGGGGEA